MGSEKIFEPLEDVYEIYKYKKIFDKVYINTCEQKIKRSLEILNRPCPDWLTNVDKVAMVKRILEE